MVNIRLIWRTEIPSSDAISNGSELRPEITNLKTKKSGAAASNNFCFCVGGWGSTAQSTRKLQLPSRHVVFGNVEKQEVVDAI